MQELFQIKQQTLLELKNLVENIKFWKDPKELLQQIKNLETELKRVKKSKRYWLIFEEKPEEFDENSKNALPLLKEVKKFSINNQENSPTNLIIEWDNYHSLSCLQYTHKWKIDVIYIDPPYNTGKDFIYNDNYIDKEDSFRHSKWLSFMKKRLDLAKDLLSEKWIIFISIDDNEFAQLKLLCDEIFWEENLKSSFCWIMSTKEIDNIEENEEIPTLWANLWDKKHSHEYIFCYGKEKAKFNLIWNSWYIESRITKNWNNISILELKKWIKCEKNITETFHWIIWWKSEPIEILNTEWMIIENWILKNNVTIKSCFANPNYIRAFFKGEKVIDNKWQEIIEVYLKNTWLPYTKKEKLWDIPTSVLSWFWDTSKWWNYLKEILWKKEFDYPKPFPLIQKLLSFSSNKSSTVLDFFAWSWTTWHAVLELNREDWWNRQFILCSNKENTKENPEKNICLNITYERNKRIIQGYTNSKWEKVPWLWWNLKYYQTDFIKIEKSRENLKTKFKNNCNDLLCIKENTFTQVKLSKEIPWIFMYKNASSYTIIAYEHIFLDEIKDLCKILDKKINLYLFSLSSHFEEDFEDIKDKVELKSIPETILEVYKKIFNF